jgi:hypothetical protein
MSKRIEVVNSWAPEEVNAYLASIHQDLLSYYVTNADAYSVYEVHGSDGSRCAVFSYLSRDTQGAMVSGIHAINLTPDIIPAEISSWIYDVTFNQGVGSSV